MSTYFYCHVRDMCVSPAYGAITGVSQMREFRKNAHPDETVQGRLLRSFVLESGPKEGAEVLELELWNHGQDFSARMAYRVEGGNAFT